MSRPFCPRKTADLSKALHQQLNSYALAASAAGMGLLASAQPVESKIVYTPAHVVIGQPFPMDLNHDGIVDFYLLHSYSHFHDEHALSVCQFEETRSARFCLSSGNNAIRDIVLKSGTFGAVLRPGDKVQRGDQFKKGRARLGGVRSFQTGSRTMWYGPWANLGKGVKNRYLGLKFRIEGQFHFGWARLSFTTTKTSFTATLTGYAYETVAGKAIVAGTTNGPNEISVELPKAFLTTPAPVPPTLGMLAIGAPALSIWRREEPLGASCNLLSSQ